MIDHWRGFRDFARLDKLSGGPDSHMKTVVELAKDFHDPAWAACLYVAAYNVPMGEALKLRFPDRHDVEGIQTWLEENWEHVALRRERIRPVATPEKLATCIRSCAYWLDTYESRLHDMESYDELWRAAEDVMYFGRYAKMKLLETLRQMGIVRHIIPDIRARGGWSPREGLALLQPERMEHLMGDDSPMGVREVEAIAAETYDGMQGMHPIDRYEFQVFLCDYKQVAVTARQYPGRSLDSELDYFRKAHPLLRDMAMFDARSRIFPAWALGEVQGWDGVRETLTEFFAQTNGEMWSDRTYDYVASMKAGWDFSKLVRRS